MILSVQEVLKNPSLLKNLATEGQKCCICNASLQGAITGKHITHNGVYCNDCYYEETGKLVED